VDTKHKLIVEQQVTNQVVDMGLLTQTAEPRGLSISVESGPRVSVQTGPIPSVVSARSDGARRQ
jgi:hypothetical protein